MSVVLSNHSPIPVPSQVQAEMPKKELGGTVNTRIATLVAGLKLANEVASFAVNKGPQALCAVTTMGDALAHFYNGNLIRGTVMGTASLKATYDLFMKNGSLEEIKKLLKDNKAGLEVTEEILGFNRVVLKQAAHGVESVGKSLSSIEKDLARVEKLSDESRKELKAEKMAVMDLYKSANAEYALAQKSFKEAHEMAQEANVYFNKTMKGFNKIAALAQQADAKLSDAIEIAEKMQRNCDKAQKKLQQCMQFQEQAKTHSEKANEIYQDASFKSGQLFGKTQEVFTQILEVTAKAQEKIEQAEQKNEKLAQNVNQLQQNNENLVRLNQALLENNGLLMKEAENAPQFGMTSMIFGAVPGALIGNAMLGPFVGGFGGGVVGLEVVHNRAKIARKTGDWLFGVKAETQLKFAAGQKVAFKFDDNSSGAWGRYVAKRASQTVGTIGIKVSNNEFFEMRFNLNDKNAVRDTDLKNLKDVLERKVATGELSPSACLDLIRSTEEMKIGSSNKTAMSAGHSFFFMLKAQCERAIK